MHVKTGGKMLHTLVTSLLFGLIVRVGWDSSTMVQALEPGRLAGGRYMGQQLADMNIRPSRELLADDPGDGASATVTVVLSGEEFMAAVLAGVEHIELNDHIILRNEDAPPWAHFEIPTSLKSITGNCYDKPFPTSGDMGTGPLVPALLNQKDGQCIFMVAKTLSFYGAGAKTDKSDFSGPVTLLERIYIRAVHYLETMHIDSDRDLFMSHVTLQGGVSIESGPPDGAGGARMQGALYAEGTTFTDLVPDDFHPYVIRAGDSTSLFQCTFHNNHVHSHAGALIVSSLHGKVRLEQCNYVGNSVSQEFFDNNENHPAVFYSDESLVVGFPLDDDIMTSPLESAGEDFMSAGDGRVAAIREVLQSAPRVVVGSGGSSNSGGNSDGNSGSHPFQGLSSTEPLPPTEHSSPSGQVSDVYSQSQHGSSDQSGADHAHDPGHKHWWHRNGGSSDTHGSCTTPSLVLPFMVFVALVLQR